MCVFVVVVGFVFTVIYVLDVGDGKVSVIQQCCVVLCVCVRARACSKGY
jgi:hypothetical protein